MELVHRGELVHGNVPLVLTIPVHSLQHTFEAINRVEKRTKLPASIITLKKEI